MSDSPETEEAGSPDADAGEEPRPIPSGRSEPEDRAGGPADYETKDGR